jgi:hypothetical protein
MKKKTQTQYNNMSVGVKQFSLNGTHRNQGYVGQTMLSRSLPRTLAKGNTLRGYGGTNGHFIRYPSVLSAVTSTEDSSVVKPSTLSYDGMIATQNRWILRPQPYTTVKPDSTHHSNTQQDYIKYIQTKTISDCNNTKLCGKNDKKCTNVCQSNVPLTVRRTSMFNFTKPESSYVARTQSDYLLNLKKKCIKPTDYKHPSSTQKTPLFTC